MNNNWFVFHAALQGRVIPETVLAPAVSDVDFVMEAVKEDEQVKRKVFKGIKI